MFVVHCSGHNSKVLLFSEHITELVNQPFGVELKWRCTCGTTGTTRIRRDDTNLVGAA
jgi:hypothetical protein